MNLKEIEKLSDNDDRAAALILALVTAASVIPEVKIPTFLALQSLKIIGIKGHLIWRIFELANCDPQAFVTFCLLWKLQNFTLGQVESAVNAGQSPVTAILHDAVKGETPESLAKGFAIKVGKDGISKVSMTEAAQDIAQGKGMAFGQTELTDVGLYVVKHGHAPN